jgi:hypothetical protein
MKALKKISRSKSGDGTNRADDINERHGGYKNNLNAK